MPELGGEWSEVSCALCDSTLATPRFVEGPHRVVDCQGCGLTYVTPRLTAQRLLAEVYDESYWASPAPRERGYGDYRGAAELYRRSFRRRWYELAPRFPASPERERYRLLDVGCAAGYFLDVVSAEGWEVRGVEPSTPIASTARERHGDAAIHVGTLDGLPDWGTFDLITLWDVLEHVPDPVATLKQARQLLAPGGTLLIETQNIDSALARLLGRRWHHFKHREHLVHFNPSTLRKAFEAAGLDLVQLHKRSAGKYVSGEFIVERSARLWSALPRLLAPLRGLPCAYLNLGDELIALGEVAS
jgi:2-polyprenyl-3-methyl-5-hydroxy-6-metoxy-1,4-benzoquinol methylase